MKAAERGDLAAVRCMIESGVPVDARNSYGETALKEACDETRPEIVTYLLQAGADINAVDNKGENSFHEAIEEYLGQGHDYLHLGGGENANYTTCVLDILIKDPRLDINAADSYGRTPLMRFAQAGKADWVEKLLKMGATVGDTDRHGRTALDRTKDPTIQKMLRDRGAS